MWALPRSGDGRWIIAQRPSIRRGKSAASLSSGGMTGAEPADRPEVGRRRQRHERTAPAVGGVGDGPLLALRQPGQARVFAAPDLLGVRGRDRATSSGSGSNVQPVTPSVLRATWSCEMPRRSSTRTSRSDLVADARRARD